MNSEIKRQLDNDFDIEGDYDLFIKIVDEMEKNAGPLKPAINWGVEISHHRGTDYVNGLGLGRYVGIKDAYENKYSTMQKMMDPWIGCLGMQRVTRETIRDYSGFIRFVDKLGLSAQYFDDNNNPTEKGKGLLNTDLGTIIDLNLIRSFCDKEEVAVLEVGGGYGRLAEGFFAALGTKKTKYLILDSVPASLLYSYKYLTRKFPEIKVGFYYNGDVLDFDLFDCYIMPSWQYLPQNFKFDVCVNVQSMQEMEQHHVDYFLNLFDNSIGQDGIVYLSNEKDYIFQGEWNYPGRWKHILSLRTPRSWTRNSPTEIFAISPKSDQHELAATMAYEAQLVQFDKISSLEVEYASAIATNLQLQEKVTEDQAVIANLHEQIAEGGVIGAKLQERYMEERSINQKMQEKINSLEMKFGVLVRRKLSSLLGKRSV